LIAPYSFATRVISRITDSVKVLARFAVAARLEPECVSVMSLKPACVRKVDLTNHSAFPKMREMIEANHLAKRFGSVKAVDDLSFRIEPGEIVGLLGRNGAGKTTTLHMLAGITRPDSGQVRVCGIDLLKEPKQAKACLGFIADEPEFFEYLTVEEHLRFSGMLYGIRDGTASADELISRFDLEEKRRAYPEELSRGMRQKLALACVLQHEPKALLLDEPLTGLDPAGMRDMKDTILARAREGAAILLSSHLLFLVEELCSRLLIVHDGRLVASGTMEEIRGAAGGGSSRELEAAFLDITSRPATSGT